MAGNYTKVPHVVIDASYCLAFLLPLESSKTIDATFIAYQEGTLELITTPLLPFEVLNGLRAAVLSKRITHDQANTLGHAFLELDIPIETVTYEEVFALAEKEKLSVYDASYLWLARSRRAKLYTFDKALKHLT